MQPIDTQVHITLANTRFMG